MSILYLGVLFFSFYLTVCFFAIGTPILYENAINIKLFIHYGEI